MLGQEFLTNTRLILKLLSRLRQARKEKLAIKQKLAYQQSLSLLPQKIKDCYFEPEVFSSQKPASSPVVIISSEEEEKLYLPALKQILYDHFHITSQIVYTNKQDVPLGDETKVYFVLSPLSETMEGYLESKIASGSALIIINNGRNNIPRFLSIASSGMVEHGSYADVSLDDSYKSLLLSLYGGKCVNIPLQENSFGVWKESNVPVLMQTKLGDGNIFVINYDLILEYLTANLFHQFNLFKGSKPEVIANALRILEYIFEISHMITLDKQCRLFITVDTEAQLQYYDNQLRASTNILSLKNKDGMLMSRTVPRIRERIRLPILFFLATGLVDKDCRDVQGYLLDNIEGNIKAIKELRSDLAIGFHGYNHEKYRWRGCRSQLSEEFVASEMEKGRRKLEELGIELSLINRYPGLWREPFCLHLLEQFGFSLDSSDFIDDLDSFIAPCSYRLYNLKGNKIVPSSVWEIPYFLSDPLVTGFNKEAIDAFLEKAGQWRNWHESALTLAFHDKVLGFPEGDEIIVYFGDLRRSRTGNLAAINYLTGELERSRLIHAIGSFSKPEE